MPNKKKAPPKTVAFDASSSSLSAVLPLVPQNGKVRVKRRTHFNEIGKPVATRSESLSQADYVEWQIGYDVLAKNKAATSLSKFEFRNEKKQRKHPYELSELLFYSYKLGFVSDREIVSLFQFIEKLRKDCLFANRADMLPVRTAVTTTEINCIRFFKTEIRSPLLVRKFGSYQVYAEIITKELQKGVGIQPMLYVCIPLANLSYRSPMFGRIADKGEKCQWPFHETEGHLAVELFKIFGMLSARHRHDTLEILKTMFPFVEKAK